MSPSTFDTMSEQIRPTGLHEFVLEVGDLTASTRFYTDVIGLTVVQTWTGDRKGVWFDMGDTTTLGLWPKETGGVAAIANGRGGSHVHFALRIPQGSFEAVLACLRSLGVPILDTVAFDDGNQSLYINDPDDNCVELMEARLDWAGTVIPGQKGENT